MTDLASYIGIPYAASARGPDTVDCAGLVMLFYRQEMGIELPLAFYGPDADHEELAEVADDGMSSGQWVKVDVPQYGDVLVFRMFGQPTHVGVYIGGDDFLHSVAGKDSCIERVSSWYSRLVGILRWHTRQ